MTSNSDGRYTTTTHQQLFKIQVLAVLVQPGPLFLVSGTVEALGALNALDVEVGGPASVSAFGVAGQGNSHFVVGLQHHVVFPQSAWAVENAYDALLHAHLVRCRAPRYWVVAATFVGLDILGKGHAALAKGQAGDARLVSSVVVALVRVETTSLSFRLLTFTILRGC